MCYTSLLGIHPSGLINEHPILWDMPKLSVYTTSVLDQGCYISILYVCTSCPFQIQGIPSNESNQISSAMNSWQILNLTQLCNEIVQSIYYVLCSNTQKHALYFTTMYALSANTLTPTGEWYVVINYQQVWWWTFLNWRWSLNWANCGHVMHACLGCMT